MKWFRKTKPKFSYEYVEFKLHDTLVVHGKLNAGTVQFKKGSTYQKSEAILSINKCLMDIMSEFIGTCVHEFVENAINFNVAYILDSDFGKIPKKWLKSLVNVNHFLTALSLNQYVLITSNQVFSKYMDSDKYHEV